MFLGDSLSIHHFETTLQAMRHGRPNWLKHLTDDNPVVSYTYDFCSEYGLQPFTMSFTKENWAVRGYVPLKKPRPQDSLSYLWLNNSIFLQNLHNQSGLVLVVNRGAWYQPDNIVKQEMADFLDFLSEDLPHATLIFRSSNMAHLNCNLYSVPQHEGESLFDPVDEPNHPEWHWKDFPSQSQRIVKPLLNNVPSAFFLDIFPSVQRRPDQHTSASDCLHYCVPGPIDLWVQFVYAILDSIEQLRSNRLSAT